MTPALSDIKSYYSSSTTRLGYAVSTGIKEDENVIVQFAIVHLQQEG
jgi:hypothetical protein